MSHTPTLFYRPRISIAGRIALNYAWLFAVLFVPATIVTASFFFIIPRFKEVFKDFRTSLPLLTQYLLEITSFVVDYWFLSIPLILLMTAAAPVLPAWYASIAPDERSERRRRRLFFWLALLFSLLLTVTVALALFLPLIKLIHSVSGGEQDRG